MVEIVPGMVIRLRKRKALFDRRKRFEGQWSDFSVGHMVRVFRVDDEGELRFHVETLSGNYEGRIGELDIVKLSALEQLGSQAAWE